MTATNTRDHETAKKIGGVRVAPIWPGARVHAFRTWISESQMETWCGQLADLEDGSEQTTALVTCQDCAEASWLAFRGRATA